MTKNYDNDLNIGTIPKEYSTCIPYFEEHGQKETVQGVFAYTLKILFLERVLES